jgi:hypothetical protein
MILCYQESNGDYLAVDTSSNRHYLEKFGQDDFEGWATAIARQVGSVCRTGVSREFLRTNCRRVARSKVPAEWLRAMDL